MPHNNISQRFSLFVNEQEIPLDGSDTSNNNESSIYNPFDVSKIRIEPKSLSLDLILARLRHHEIALDPDFQRQNGIWSAKAQSRLIESLLLRIPIPAFYFDATNNDNWLVVDGLQRLTAIKSFVIDETLILSNLEFLGEDFNKKRFSDLPRQLQRIINETILVTYLIMPGTPEEVKFNVFQRINTGGLPLSSQEIRHALNQGIITKKLGELANTEEFQRATSYGVSHRRMDDRECITRFIVFSMFPPDAYEKDDFDAFLNAGMKKANTLSQSDLDALGDNFMRVMRWAYKIFGDDAFRKRYRLPDNRYPINKALFEAWSVNMGRLSDQQLAILVERKDMLIDCFIKIMHDREFENSITQGTGSTSRVHLRFAKIEEIILEVLHA